MFVALAEVYKQSVATKTRIGRLTTALEKMLVSNAARAHATLAIAKGVISAQEAGEITVAVANRILTSLSRIADTGRQLSLIYQGGSATARSQQGQIRSLITQIEQSAQEVRTRLKGKLSLAVEETILPILAMSLIGAKLPAVFVPLVHPLLFRWFCWMKYQTSPDKLAQKRDACDLRAYDRLAKINRLLYQWRHGELRPQDWRFRTNEVHSTLILEGLPYGLGSLTEKELADCFDELCPCGKMHSENVRKLKNRILKKERTQP